MHPTHVRRPVRRFVSSLLLLAAACRDSTAPPEEDPTADFTVAPGLFVVRPGEEVRLVTTTTAGTTRRVNWLVNGIAGGNATLGRIEDDGTYRAPVRMPGDSVVIGAAAKADPSQVRTATLFFIPRGDEDEFRIVHPRVIDVANPVATRLLLKPPTGTASVRFELLSGGTLPVTPIGSGLFTTVIPADVALANYVTGLLHNFAGFVDELDPAGNRLRRVNTFVNVRDAGMPPVAIVPAGADAQRSPHLLNLRLDSLTGYASPAIVTRALQTLGSGDVDFVSVIASVHTTRNRIYISVRNDVQGIGSATFDFTPQYGGHPRLQGVISFPIDGFFDGAITAMSHEIGHRWLNFATHQPLMLGRPHWRPSSMASGVMGYSLSTGAGGSFPWLLDPVAADSVRVDARTGDSGRFDPLDLYVMGLLPSDSVPTRYLLDSDINPGTLVHGRTYGATPYTVADYIAHHGVRVPSSATARRAFAMATVILSAGRLLSPAEMAFFDHAARRGETRVALPARSGGAIDPGLGFYLATGGRATLRTALP